MASLIYLDTHIVAWLYAQGRHAIPPKAAQRIEITEDLRISPMVRLELHYLFEIGRVNQPALQVLDALESTLGLTVCRAAFAAVVREAETQNWTVIPLIG